MASNRYAAAPEQGLAGTPHSFGDSYGYGDPYGTHAAQGVTGSTGSAGSTGTTATLAAPTGTTTHAPTADGYGERYLSGFADGDSGPEPATGEWVPSAADPLAQARGRHRITRQRGGTMARSRAVLGVGVIAAVGAGGMTTAHQEGALGVSGLGGAAEKVRAIPDGLPLVGGSGGAKADATQAVATPAEMVAQAPFTAAGLTPADVEAGQTDAGEALRARILQQADQAENSASEAEREEAVAQAEAEAVEEAAALAEAEREAEAERRRQEALERLRASYTLPLASYNLSASFGEVSSYWASTHTGQDFAAPTGTPVKNVHTGVVTEAAWAGDYGYRIIVQLEDGTEIWYCHLSSMNVYVGQEVVTEDVIGHVGSTGNSSGPHLHVEVRPGGGDPVDPLTWLREKGVSV